MAEPSKIPVPFAESGTKNEIPQTTDERGRASWGAGFPAETSIPVTEGGMAPKRADFNGLFHALSAAVKWQQQGNHWSYDNEADYLPNAIVTYNGELYLCTAANGPSTAVRSPLETAFWTALTSAGKLNIAALSQGTANISISGSSANAVADGEGNTISDTYMPKSGGNFAGDVTVKGESILTQSGGTIFGDLDVRGTTTSKEVTSGAIVDETGVTNEVRVVLDNAVTDGTSSGKDDSVFKVIVKGHNFKIGDKTAEAVFEVTPNMGLYINGNKVATIASNVASATKLATARKINGVDFDGTSDITVKDDTKLPLSGGTMTGTIFTTTPYVIRVPKNDGFININGDTDNGGGGYIQIFGRSHSTNPGEIKLIANTTDSSQTLRLCPDGSLTWGGVDVLNPVGTVIAFAANSAPSGYLLCNGSAVSRSTYAALFAKIGTTYGAGNGSTSFNLPNLTDKFIQGSGTAGKVKNAGLPNIYGGSPRSIIRDGSTSEESGGLITMSSGSYAEIPTSGGSYIAGSYLIFDAAKANAIYGNSTTVQPPALTMRYYIKY